MSEIVPFDYSGRQVRTLDLDGSTWFVAADVCDVLGLRNASEATRGLDADERSSISSPDGTPGNPTTLIISEPGLYSLLVRSRRPEAKPFRRWVTHEVLPSIRRTGTYAAPGAVAMADPRDELAVLRTVVDQMIATRELARRAEAVAVGASDDARVANVRLDAIEGRHDWYAALGWAKLTGWSRTDDVTLARLGRIAGTVGRAQGLAAGKSPHAHYGEVNTWPRHVWDDAAARFAA